MRSGGASTQNCDIFVLEYRDSLFLGPNVLGWKSGRALSVNRKA